jgi:hypothetical protein
MAVLLRLHHCPDIATTTERHGCTPDSTITVHKHSFRAARVCPLLCGTIADDLRDILV